MNEKYIDWHGIADLFNCGRNKALKIIHELDPVYIGRSPYTTLSKLDKHLAEKGDVKVDWRY